VAGEIIQNIKFSELIDFAPSLFHYQFYVQKAGNFI